MDTDRHTTEVATWLYVQHIGLQGFVQCGSLVAPASDLCVTAEEVEQEKAQAAVKAEKAKKEKQKSKKGKQKVTVSGIWKDVYSIRSHASATFYIFAAVGFAESAYFPVDFSESQEETKC